MVYSVNAGNSWVNKMDGNVMAEGTRSVVMVTGAAKRIGREIALDLARHGFDIALHFRKSSLESEATLEDVRGLGVQAYGFFADFVDEMACKNLVPAVVSRLGRLDAVINNASHFDYDNAKTFSYASMDAHWRANTAPAIVLAQALFEHVLSCGRRGCVINITDQKLWNPNPDYLSYTLSKAALDTATTLLAQELAPQVRVVGIAPGLTLISGPNMDKATFVRAHQMTPLGYASTPEDIARTVRFVLASPAITGSTLLVDGGQHLSHQTRDVAFLCD